MRCPEKDRIARSRPQNRQTRAKPGSPGALDRYQNKQRVENAGHGHAGGIEYGKE